MSDWSFNFFLLRLSFKRCWQVKIRYITEKKLKQTKMRNSTTFSGEVSLPTVFAISCLFLRTDSSLSGTSESDFPVLDLKAAWCCLPLYKIEFSRGC